MTNIDSIPCAGECGAVLVNDGTPGPHWCLACTNDDVREGAREDREPDYDYVPTEQTSSYREAMQDAGRGHLL